MEYVKAHISRGHKSRLFSFHRNPYLPADKDETVIDYPSPGIPFYRLYNHIQWRIRNREHELRESRPPQEIPRYQDMSFAAVLFRKFRDLLIKDKVKRVIKEYDLENADIIHLDNGMGFFSDSRYIKDMKSKGKSVLCCYHGSDLRLRGVVPDIDTVADMNITSEYDLLDFHPRISHLFYPFNSSVTGGLQAPKCQETQRIRIAHSPTNRVLKGTEIIEEVIDKLQEEYDIELVLIEGVSRREAIELKSTCHLLIDQIGGKGGTGYGVSALESFAMSQAVVTDFTDAYNDFLGNHPFYVAQPENLCRRLRELLSDPCRINEYGEKGRIWLENTHSYEAVNRRLKGVYAEFGYEY
ncbi:MAG: glycosyltransferase [Chitinivibrionales bacterium]